MSIVTAILAALPIIGQIISLFQKTPEEKYAERTKELMDFIQKIHAGVAQSQVTQGDTSAIEDAINDKRNS